MLFGLVPLLGLGAAVLNQRRRRIGLAVVGGVGDEGPLRLLADVFAVDQKALLAAFHLQDELGDRGVGDGFEGVSDAAALAGVDPADQVDVYLAFQGGDQVR